MAKEQGKPGSSQKAKNLSARLTAVQAQYQIMHNQQPVREMIADFLKLRAGMEINGETLVEPDEKLVRAILGGVEERMVELDTLISHQLQSRETSRQIEYLLKALFLCATFELLAHEDLDKGIIINDYLNIAHGFFEDKEVGFVNGVLDAVATALRP